MLHAVLSDIHSNIEALEAVLHDAGEAGAGNTLCLGDIVGYGANPKECIARIKGLNGVVVAGNHDYAACQKTSIEYFNPYARQAAIWTADQINDDEKSYIVDLPLVHETQKYCLVHASLDEPEVWEYVLSSRTALRSFEKLKQQILFIGHSHVPWIFVFDQNKEIESYKSQQIEFEDSKKYIVNVGSVGQPRDLDPRASYCLYDEVKNSVQFRRVSYDFSKTQEKIRRAKLPEILASRLETGR